MAVSTGTSAAEQIVGTSTDDTISGLAGNDTLIGSAGADVITGGDGDDSITSGAGSDNSGGGAGNDTVRGGADADEVKGGAGNDSVFGGAGNDTVRGGAGNDVLTGGAGNDTLYAGAGNDTLTGGDGVDSFIFSAETGSSDTITDFADGTDIINISSVSGVTGISGLTITNVTGGALISATGLSITVTGATASSFSASDFTFSTVPTEVAQTFVLSGSNDTISGTSLGDTINATSSTYTSGDVISAGGGSDTINFTGGGSINLNTASSINGVENVVINDSTATTLTMHNSNNYNVTGGGVIDTFSINLSAKSLGADTINGAAGVDIITFTGAAATLVDTDFTNILSVATLTLGDFDDQTIVLSTASVAAGIATINASALTGSNQVTVTASGRTTDAISFTGGAGNDTITATAGNDTIDGGTGDDSITAGTGDESINGAGGNDDFVFTNAGFTTADSINGGAGTDDEIHISDAATVINADFTNITANSVEELVLDSTASGQSVTLGAAASAAGIVRVDASALTGTNSVTINLTGHTNNTTVTTAGGADVITTGSGADTISSGGQNDSITSNLGADSLTGGSGDDDFITTENADANYMIITDFVTTSDDLSVVDSTYAWFNGASDGVVVLATGADMDALHAANNDFTVGNINTDMAGGTIATFIAAGVAGIGALETAAATAMGTATNADFGATDKVLIAVDDGTSTAIFYVQSAGDGNAISAGEIQLLAILQSVTADLAAGDFLFA